MLTLNLAILAEVVTAAKASAAGHPRWVKAIERAERELMENPWIEAQDDHTLLIGSSSGDVYLSNGVCSCEAYKHGQPCKHRAAARLYKRYTEAEKRSVNAAEAQAAINELF